MNRQQGFTLLEVMVATVILGTGLAAISGAIGTAVRSTALATGYEQARQVAESQLALFVAGQPAAPEQHSGNENNITWKLNARHHPELANLLDISIEVQFYVAGGTRTLSITTAQLVHTDKP